MQMRREPREAKHRFGLLKRWIPASLFSRALLILVVPMVVLQLQVAHIFYDRHWKSVVRNMSFTTASDIVMLVKEYEALSPKLGTREARAQTIDRGNTLGITVTYQDTMQLWIHESAGRNKFPDFFDNLEIQLDRPVQILASNEDTIEVRLNAYNGVLDFSFARKRLASSTTWIFILWMVGSAALLMLVAVLFLRNQIRPIVALARAAEQFGLGQEVHNFQPRGASEVRRAGRAFLMMAERTRRHLQNRTEMLAGISHDLRTPLTRMKLELELGTVDAATKVALAAEIDEMQMMIDEYLDFARGDTGESPEATDIAALMKEIMAQYQRSGDKVTLANSNPVVLMVRPQALRRALTNLIDNALRYGGGVALCSIEQSATFLRIKILDAGPGIAENEQEAVFKPFTRLEPSRNLATGGVGLGLSIVRSIAQQHGGEVSLENKRGSDGTITGLEVTLRLPRAMQSA